MPEEKLTIDEKIDDAARLYWLTLDDKTGAMERHTGHMIDDLLVDD